MQRGTVTLVQPPEPALEGTDERDYRDPNGVAVVQEIDEAARRGGDFVEYVYKKPDGSTAPKVAYATRIPGTQLTLGTGIYLDNVERDASELAKLIDAQVTSSLTQAMIIVLFLIAGMGWYAWANGRQIVAGLEAANRIARRIAAGEVDVQIFTRYNDEIGTLLKEMKTMVENLRSKSENARAIAQGDLTVKVHVHSPEDMLGNALQQMIQRLGQLIQSIDRTSSGVAANSMELSHNSQQLSQSSAEQASALEEISASMERINNQIETNAKNAGEANGLAQTSRQQAEQGNEQMRRMLDSMKEISQSSEQVSAIMRTIEEIAFQTNVLAINAAIEAARAGEYGKGFSVVAEEVRNLAQRSATAAKETAEMLQDSSDKVAGGVKTADETAESLHKIVELSSQVTHLIDGISSASSEQSRGAREINEGLAQLNQTTQHSAQIAQQAAGAGQQLEAQSQQLRGLLGQFRLQELEGPAAGPRALPQ